MNERRCMRCVCAVYRVVDQAVTLDFALAWPWPGLASRSSVAACGSDGTRYPGSGSRALTLLCARREKCGTDDR